MNEFEALVARVLARVMVGAVSLGRLWSGFSARLRRALRDHRDEFERILTAEARAAGIDSGRVMSATARDAGALGAAHAGQVLERLVRRAMGIVPPPSPDLGPFGREVADDVAARLREALGTWRDQAHAEEQIVQITGEHLDRVLTGNQTESFRAYRGGLMAGYRSVAEVDRIVRMERLDSLTCAVCWALHGEVLPVAEDIAVHPNCRGIPVPVLIGEEPGIGSGPATFETLSEAEKREILGPRRYEMYSRGELRLADVVHRGEHPEFGPFVRMRTVRELDGSRVRRAAERGSGGGGGRGGGSGTGGGGDGEGWRLPSRAFIPDDKIEGYLLNANHTEGGTKARFLARLGITADQGELLRREILRVCRAGSGEFQYEDRYGKRYRFDGVIVGPAGSGRVYMIWIDTEDDTHFVTLYPAPRDRAL